MSSAPTPDEDFIFTEEEIASTSDDPIAHIDPQKIAEFNAAAWEEMIERSNSALFRLIRKKIRRTSDIEDVVQDIYIKVWRSRYDPSRGSAWVFLKVCMKSIVLDYYRKQERSAKEITESGLSSVDAVDLITNICPDYGIIRKEKAKELIDQIRDIVSRMSGTLKTFSELYWLSGAYDGATGKDHMRFNCRNPTQFYKNKSLSRAHISSRLLLLREKRDEY